MMRTNIVIDEALIRETMSLSGLKTKRAAVHEALESYNALKRQESATEKLWGLVPDWDGELDAWRRDV